MDTKNREEGIYLANAATKLEKGEQVLCPECGGKRCFTLYIDENGEPLHPTVGRCDHESACAYHYTPKEYFRDHPDAKPGHNWRVLTPEQRKRLFPQHKEPKPLCTIPSEYVTR